MDETGPYRSPDLRRVKGERLQKIREDWFRLHPLCARCRPMGFISLAVELDHIVALANGGPDFDVDEGKNRQGLCKPCHRIKTAEDLGYRVVHGSNPDGTPADPSHHWNLNQENA